MKYTEMFARRASKGQCVNQPYLGCREFAADFRLVHAGCRPSHSPPPIPDTRELGWMLHDLDFTHPTDPQPRFFNARRWKQGVIEVPPFEEAHRMILQALNSYYRRKCDDPDPAQRLPAFGLEQKDIPFVLEITATGELVQLRDTRTPQGKKKVAQSFRVPMGVKKTSGVAANLLWDTLEYVLGRGHQRQARARGRATRQLLCSALPCCLPMRRPMQAFKPCCVFWSVKTRRSSWCNSSLCPPGPMRWKPTRAEFSAAW
jgi:hypothetical protein